MKKFLEHKHYYLVGIKGVAMTAMATCLLDVGKKISGSDVEGEFVTQPILNKNQIQIDVGFENELSKEIDCLIYTAAHQGKQNPQVQAAIKKKIPVYSHAEALSFLFNSKKGVAVCGVGGKSSVSAMIAWILEHTNQKPSYAVGVGKIIDLPLTGRYREDSKVFVVEADEYAANPVEIQDGEKLIPRFSYLKPKVVVCTNLAFDHPDVYKDFAHTKEVYKTFFKQIKEGGTLIYNMDNAALVKLVSEVKKENKKIKNYISYGESKKADFQLAKFEAQRGLSKGTYTFNKESFEIQLSIPGKFNILNAVAAIAAVHSTNPKIKSSDAISKFRSTKRRFEFIDKKNGVTYYDDYAHHPSEVKVAITALNDWYPNSRKVIAFQSHTFSRTKELFDDFVDAFAEAKEVVMIDIFASAREKSDVSVSSETLCKAIRKKYPKIKAQNLKTIKKLATFCKQELKSGDVMITLGAGDIYEVHTIV